MNKIIVIGGYPGTGKSTIVKSLLKKLDKLNERFAKMKYESLSYMESKSFIILGKYDDGELFPGTDKLPMNIQPIAKEFIAKQKKTILMEGDRLFNMQMLDFIQEEVRADLFIYIVEVEENKLNERRSDRGTNQNIIWLKGRKTKVDNIKNNMFYKATILPNNNDKQFKASVDTLLEALTRR